MPSIGWPWKQDVCSEYVLTSAQPHRPVRAAPVMPSHIVRASSACSALCSHPAPHTHFCPYSQLSLSLGRFCDLCTGCPRGTTAQTHPTAPARKSSFLMLSGSRKAQRKCNLIAFEKPKMGAPVGPKKGGSPVGQWLEWGRGQPRQPTTSHTWHSLVVWRPAGSCGHCLHGAQ